MEQRCKITALRDVFVAANVWKAGSRELPRSRVNESQGTMPVMKSEECKFHLAKDEAKEVFFVHDVREGEGLFVYDAEIPALEIGKPIIIKGLLQIERLE